MSRPRPLLMAALLIPCLCFPPGAALATDSWIPAGNTIPSGLVWDQAQEASVDAANNGTTAWDYRYSIRSVASAGAEAQPLDRWGATYSTSDQVAPTEGETFPLRLVGPPISGLAYALPVTPTRPPISAAMDNSWMLAKDGTLLPGLAAVDASTTVTRFPDTAPGTAGAWAAGYVEECAGRVPLIVGGYGDGTYKPALAVDRATMAVFMQRAMELPMGIYAGVFSDVPIGYWADRQIQSCVDARIVGGYPDGSYKPTVTVDRATMAVFVARAMEGGDSLVPSGPPTPKFPDVPPGHWAYKYVEDVVAHSVVGGYPDGSYRPTVTVDRAAMAVFVYRAAIQPTGAVVVLAGPAVTRSDTGDYDGWTSAAMGEAAAPGTAYVGFDAVRAPAADIALTFELRDASTPTTPATGSYIYRTTLTAADVATKQTAAESDGNPYVYSRWAVPSDLEEGDYNLVVTVNGTELARRPAFTIGPLPIPTLTVNNTASGNLDSRLFGQMMEKCYTNGERGVEVALVPGTHALQPSVFAKLDAMDISVIRFPGGLDADYITWSDLVDNAPGRGSATRPSDDGRGNTTRYGYTELLNDCETWGTQAMFPVNLRSALYGFVPVADAAQLAANLVAYCNATSGPWAEARAVNGHPAPYGVKYFEIGNETWFWWDDLLAGRSEAETAELYLSTIQAYITKMRAVDPSIEIIIDGDEWHVRLRGSLREPSPVPGPS